MGFKISDEKLAQFHALGTPEAQQKNLMEKVQDPIKRQAILNAYKVWKENKSESNPAQPTLGRNRVPQSAGSGWQAAGQGFLTGATWGFKDELAGLAGAAGYKMAEPEGQSRSFWDIYREAKGESAAKDKALSEAHPWLYGGGEVAGGLASAAAAPLNAATLAGKVGMGFVGGATAALGYSEPDLTTGNPENYVETGKNMVVGGVAGGALAPAAESLTALAGRWAGQKAGEKAFDAANPQLSDLKEIAKPERIASGRRMLDEDIVNFGSSAQNVAKNIAPAREKAGQEIGHLYGELDTWLGASPNKTLDPQKVSTKIREAAGEHYPTAADRDVRELLEREAQAFEKQYTPDDTEYFLSEGAQQARRGPSQRGPLYSGTGNDDALRASAKLRVAAGSKVFTGSNRLSDANPMTVDGIKSWLKSGKAPRNIEGVGTKGVALDMLDQKFMSPQHWRLVQREYARAKGFDAYKVLGNAEEGFGPEVHGLSDTALENVPHNELPGPLNFRALQKEKTANWKKGYETQDFQPTRRASAYRKLAHALGESIDEEALEVAPNTWGRLKTADERFAQIAPADEISTNAAAKAQMSKGLGFTDYMAMLAGLNVGGPLGAGAVAAGKYAVKTRGDSASAVLLNNVARFAGSDDVPGLIARAMRKNPERLGKYMGPLTQAAGMDAKTFEQAANKVAELLTNEE